MDKKQVVGSLVMVALTVSILFSHSVLSDDALANASNYEVTAEGYGGPIRLMVYVEGEEIIDIEALEQNETEGLGDKAIEEMIAKILENQSTDVDVRSGATRSSNAVINAVNNVFGEADDESPAEYHAEGFLAIASGYGGDVVLDVILEGDEIVDIQVLDQSETPDLGDAAIDAMIAKILEAQSTEGVDVETGATASSGAVIKAVSEATGQEMSESEAPQDPAAEYDLASYDPQGMLVSGKGFQDRSDIYLDVIFDGNEIAEIRVIDHGETKGFGDGALRAIPERIVNQQSAEVDVQTGATWTSNATMEIVQQAVEQAGVTLGEPEAGDVTASSAKSSGGGT